MSENSLSAEDRHELKELEVRLRSGDRSAVEPWCLIFERASESSAAKAFSKKSAYPGDWNDLAQDGVIVALKIANKLLSGEQEEIIDPDKYVWASVKHRIVSKVVGKVGSKAMPSIGRRDRAVPEELTCDAATLCKLRERLDQVLSCCENEFERQVITELVDHKPAKVATTLRVSVKEVHEARLAVMDRLSGVLAADGELGLLGRPRQGRQPSKPREWPVSSPMRSGAPPKYSPLSPNYKQPLRWRDDSDRLPPFPLKNAPKNPSFIGSI
jgi:hypothetical protein